MIPQRNISVEEKLLLCLCRMDPGNEQSQRINELIPVISDWSFFLSLANAHGVIAITYNNLEKLNLQDALPGGISSAMRNSRMRILGRSEFNMKIMADFLGLLNHENIETVLLKGMALELMVYGNQGIRQMSDIDILVREDRCIRAREILMANGYRSLPVKSVLYKLILRHVGKHLPSLEKDGVIVEIHHELFGKSGNGLTRMFIEKSRETVLKGEKVLLPDPQLLFLYLIRHLWLHEQNNESQLRLYADLAALIENNFSGIFTPGLPELIIKAGLEEPVSSRLMILERYWGLSVPGLTDFIKKWQDPAFNDKFLFFLKSPKGNPSIDKSWYYRHFVSEIPGFHRKVVFILGDLFPTIRFMKKRYGCSSGWKAILFYPHRLGKLILLAGSRERRAGGR